MGNILTNKVKCQIAIRNAGKVFMAFRYGNNGTAWVRITKMEARRLLNITTLPGGVVGIDFRTANEGDVYIYSGRRHDN